MVLLETMLLIFSNSLAKSGWLAAPLLSSIYSMTETSNTIFPHLFMRLAANRMSIAKTMIHAHILALSS